MPEETADKRIVRKIDGKEPGDEYEDAMKRRAMFMYATGEDISTIAQRIGIAPNLVQYWKDHDLPDSRSWDQVKFTINLGTFDEAVQVLGPQTSEEFARQIMLSAQQLLSMAREAMNTPKLYDENGDVVEFLFDERGKPVQIALRPKTVAELSTMVKTAHMVLKDTQELLGAADERNYRRRRDRHEDYRLAMKNMIQELDVLMTREGVVGEGAHRVFEALKRSTSAMSPLGPTEADWEIPEEDWKQLEAGANDLRED